MSIKTEICYKFFFPKYNSLSISTDDVNFVPDSDGVDQLGEVRALCRECPERVITYDQLDADNPIAMYANKWDNNPSAPYSRTFIKNCIDKYLEFPKYFNLRNYLDAYPCQEGGMTLMISHSPEIGHATDYTKFYIKENNSDIDDKIVYCTVMVSSGDFFYSYCLPNEIITKSGLADKVVRPAQYNGVDGNKTPLLRFHNNWCFNQPEKNVFRPVLNVQLGQEKRVFVQHYFRDGFQYGAQNNKNTFYYLNFSDTDGNIYNPFDGNIHCKDILGKYTNELGTAYTGSYKNFPPDEYVDHYYINDDIQANRLTRHTYTSKVTNSEAIKVVEHASNYIEDIKQDFIALEVTRRILYYYNGEQLMYNNTIRDIHPTRDIPRIIGNTSGNDTVISYEPPDEYIDLPYIYKYNNYSSSTVSVQTVGTPPLQIPYNLLRYCLNDRPPFTDCETVLIMWIATPYRDSSNNLITPDSISDSDPDKVKKLHNLNWQQYAIPISMRCHTKDNTANTTRFLVLYPHAATSVADDEYAYHYRRAENYNKNIFKEAAYIQDLIKYSTDYIIAYNHTSYFNRGFNIQKHLCSNYTSKFRALYVKKAYQTVSYKREFQTYYVKVDNSDNIYHINTSLSDRCFAAGASGSANFIPSQSLTRAKYEEKWNLIYDNEWLIRDDWFIALFDASDESTFLKRTGKLTLYNSNTLRTYLQSIYSSATWDDIYISSLGISPTDQVNGHFVKTSHFNGSTIILPLGILDGYIQIDGITYGSNTSNHLAIVGLKDVFDYTQDDYHHFKYVSDTYQLTKGVNNNYTAYVMQIQ